MVDGDRVDRALDGPREEGVLARERTISSLVIEPGAVVMPMDPPRRRGATAPADGSRGAPAIARRRWGAITAHRDRAGDPPAAGIGSRCAGRAVDRLEAAQDGRRGDVRRRPRSSASSRPRSASRPGPARPCRRASTSRRAGRPRSRARVRASPSDPSGSSPAASNRTSTWLRTTSLRIRTRGPAASRSAIRRASAQPRSIMSTRPERPSERRAASTGKPRARRDDSGTQL